jgi:uncharacterized protein (DUF952 family)/glycerophosphoryl diester phosphodiesterase
MERPESAGVFYQAHRGSIDEAPENTLPAFRHAWRFPGAIPETDVRTTADGVLVCLHDATLARTTDAPVAVRDRPVRTLTLAEVRRWDAGVRFSADFAGLRVPTLDELLDEMVLASDRRLYVEPKDVDLAVLRRKLDDYGVVERVIFVSGHRAMLRAIQEAFPGAPAMTWAGGTPEEVRRGVAAWCEGGLAGISQLQLHLPVRVKTPEVEYALDDAYLAETQRRLRAEGVALELRPFAVDVPALQRLLNLGVRWYVADAPGHFWACLGAALAPSQGLIYHIAARANWTAAQAAGEYWAPSLAAEGYIHCSQRGQLLEVANAFFQGSTELVLLAVDAERVGPSLRYEPPAHALGRLPGGLFPHVYGPIPVDAVTAAAELAAGPDGEFHWPAGLA